MSLPVGVGGRRWQDEKFSIMPLGIIKNNNAKVAVAIMKISSFCWRSMLRVSGERFCSFKIHVELLYKRITERGEKH